MPSKQIEMKKKNNPCQRMESGRICDVFVLHRANKENLKIAVSNWQKKVIARIGVVPGASYL